MTKKRTRRPYPRQIDVDAIVMGTVYVLAVTVLALALIYALLRWFQ